jgi:hypothetical protein
MKKLLLSFGIFALFLTGFLFVGAQHAAAAQIWCGVLADPSSPNGTVNANCANGQLYVPGALSGVGNVGTPSATLKANLINYINNKAVGGYGFQKIGVQFIKNGLDGGTGTWAARLNQGAVTLKMETFNSCGTAWPNTAFDITLNKVVTDPVCKTATPALVIRSGGVIKYAIKFDCGNPMGNLTVLPAPLAWTLTGNSTVSVATANPGNTVTFKHTVHNAGPSTAGYTWTIEQSNNGGAWFNVAAAGVATGAGGNNPNALPKNLTIPAGTANNDTFCQRVFYTFAGGPGTVGGASAKKCVTVIVPPTFDGVKVDDSGFPGGSSTGYGGNCSSTTQPVNCAGGLAAYPFSDAVVKVSGGVLSSTANPFIKGNFPTGSYTVSIAPGASPETGWQLAGYSICTTGPTCTSKYLTTKANMTPVPGGLTSYSFLYLFSNGLQYHIRWIYEPTIALVSCPSPVTSPSTMPEDGEVFDMTAHMSTSNQAAFPPDSLAVTVKNNVGTPAYSYGPTNQAYTSTPVVVGSSTITSSPIAFPGLAFGTYTVTTTLTGPDVVNSSGVVTAISCAYQLNIVRRPYFKVYGGDIFAGGEFKSATGVCTAAVPASGNLTGQYRAGVGGAGTELAAIATIKISGVASASLRTSFPTEPNGLTFANTGTAPPVSTPGIMGGYYGAGQDYCAPNYFNDEQFVGLSGTPYSSPVDVSGPALADHGQTLITTTPGQSVQLYASAPVNIRHTVFVNGDVQITGNIAYAAVGGNDPTVIPYLTIIAKGNIYISPGVTNISGLFIAQRGAPGTGYVFTCRDVATNTPSGTSFGSACKNKLTINGAFIAQRVILQRTIGSLLKATGFGGVHEPAGSPNVAEVFQDSPELYVGSPVFKLKSNPYDSIKGLPPVL